MRLKWTISLSRVGEYQRLVWGRATPLRKKKGRDKDATSGVIETSFYLLVFFPFVFIKEYVQKGV